MFRTRRRLLLAAIALPCLLIATFGCGEKEEKAPPGYYTGPMASKGGKSTTSDSPFPQAPTNNPNAGK